MLTASLVTSMEVINNVSTRGCHMSGEAIHTSLSPSMAQMKYGWSDRLLSKYT